MTIPNLDNPNHVFVIAEAGSNWKVGTYKNDLSRAKQLIKTAAKCGADAVKFQTYDAKGVYVSNAGKSSYLSKTGIKKSITEIFDEFSMPYRMIAELSDYCSKNKILFMSTPFSVADAKAVNKHVKIHKVASYEINHIQLLKFLASTKKPIILSTGAATYEEIDFALKLLRKNGAKNLALLQCTACYPARTESMNISVIRTLKEKYGIPVGLSDHNVDPITPAVLAVGFGATIIEKHFTLNRKLSGPDHFFALEPNELKNMISAIRTSEKLTGSSYKRILKEETELRKFAVRAIQATRDIRKGEIIRQGYNVEILRPGNQKRGADPRFIQKVVGKRANRKIKAGEGVQIQDCKK
jgi:N-acetylneuraminate synthase